MFTFLVPIIAFLGFVIGAFLAYVSPEEMKAGRPYFIWLLRAISAAIILSLSYFSGFSFWGLLLGMAFGFFVREYVFVLGLAIAVSLGVSNDAFFLLSALTFAFGIIYGTIVWSFRRLSVADILRKVVFFFIPFGILLFSMPSRHGLMFAAGAFIMVFALKFFGFQAIAKKDISP